MYSGGCHTTLSLKGFPATPTGTTYKVNGTLLIFRGRRRREGSARPRPAHRSQVRRSLVLIERFFRAYIVPYHTWD